MVAPALKRLRSEKGQATMRTKRQTDPEYRARWREMGTKLATFRASLSSAENAAIQQRSTTTYLATTTSEERAAISRCAGKATAQKYPDNWQCAQKASTEKARSPEGRAAASARFTRLWQDPQHREKVSKANRQAVLDGRIPLLVRSVRPTPAEKRLIELILAWKLPLQYVGDNRLRIPTPRGTRHWRNPDFVCKGQQKVVLLDQASSRPTQSQETAEYERAGYSVLRVLWRELKSTKVLEARLRAFLGL